SSNAYAWSPLGPRFNNRVRPVAYYEDVDFGLRSQGNSRNSFFSGHANTTALGTFFFAKVLSDYNPQWNGRQRALLFGAAALPPIYVSWQRVRALKHFPSDTVMGLAVGAFFGIMTPQVHKNWAKKHRTHLSITGGYTADVGGAGFTLTF
ncbi:MAG: phosphatase PAP2 family protein, partial [Bacteroidota bacterium]